MTRAFLDTNVIVYAFDDRDRPKHGAARAVLQDPSITAVVSTQVLVETANVLLRGLAEPWSMPTVRRIVDELSSLEVVVTDAGLVASGLAESDRWQFSIWDGLIVAAARQAQVDVLLTEDLSHGQDLDGITVTNPFLDLTA